MLNEKVCVGYCDASNKRCRMIEKWTAMFEAMPIGVPMTATEIAEVGTKALNLKWFSLSHYQATHMLKAMGMQGYIKREERPLDKPLEVLDYNGKVVKVITTQAVFTRIA